MSLTRIMYMASNDIKLDTVYNEDSRHLNKFLNKQIVDVTITSPPYFDLKDYGHKMQIGFGQEYSKYLEDLKIVFKNIYDCTKDSGSLWVIIDSFRKNNEVTPLPFDFSNKLKEIGWKLQEVIIWEKDRTVPWTHKGQMRNLFEYILLFSKNDQYNFFIDEVRDISTLKKWWVKYPERYNPKGKTPDGLWKFDIPTQGSWGSGYIRHFCPLPEEMIGQILKISSKEGDIVLDPFAGSGAVLAKASYMKRSYVGFELNKRYIKMFEKYLSKTASRSRAKYLRQEAVQISQSEFEKLILNLRLLKLPKILLKKLPLKFSKCIKKIYVTKLDQVVSKKNALSVGGYFILIDDSIEKSKLLEQINLLLKKPPLSKFGIEASIKLLKTKASFLGQIPEALNLFTYTRTVTHKYKQAVTKINLDEIPDQEVIVSGIVVDLNENDYE